MKPPKKMSTGKTPKPPLNDIENAIIHTANPRTIISSRPIKSAILVPRFLISYYWVDTSCVPINNWIPETH